MAQISQGIKLGYAVATEAPARPGSYTYIPDITGIPALGASPSTHQVTDLDNTSHVYIKGLADIGGNLTSLASSPAMSLTLSTLQSPLRKVGNRTRMVC